MVDQADFAAAAGKVIAHLTEVEFDEWDFDKDSPRADSRCVTVGAIDLDVAWTGAAITPCAPVIPELSLFDPAEGRHALSAILRAGTSRDCA